MTYGREHMAALLKSLRPHSAIGRDVLLSHIRGVRGVFNVEVT